MARTHGTGVRKVRLWRWRRNPLRRRSDLVEAWVLLAVLVLTLSAAVLVGLAAAAAVDDSLAERRDRTRTVPAVLVEDAAHAAPASVSENGDGAVWAPVRWTAPDGTDRTGRTEVEPGNRAGTAVTVWTDPGGRLVPPPPGGAEARFQIVMAGVTTGVAVAGLGLLGGRLVRSRLQRRRLGEWEAEWRLVEPSWRKRMTG
ncbi:Rv1733c family protein [Streptomyces griseomycini]|uniref:Proline rich protein membrane protein n=1 Tax=Streptomyces griseomycini TaxID=66895 RepID=A0A7W7LZ02_9ACTN|nr:hypothetical protein [Streptomyces griseomycini]MBB4898947.1 hypothetical protein [Streptomyces griseomycini]GGR22333.1 hypothetical protein GCM10015536_30250 [Streptomyces griseomycini]